ncbi:hypothetical protein BGW36DRAFT_357667 [Talaromyces proteolyticus]|uniref:O-methyltransferase domain-containing protein n=1 Tax=Talaromyces proteolyticus TaxID=1131652 RepID=A0AAD4KUC0_9EURO|nr:uncharacterized protein BGW36DRAFT_357667 [Talaromyces proteolyticus]KAH8701037.1 hypothetical protein BGW36DRAFT_357667 [Talaromyces proteolyticus]
MDQLAKLEALAGELLIATKSLLEHCHSIDAPLYGTSGRPAQLIPPGARAEAHRARESTIASLTKLRVMLAGPTDFLQDMASQSQLLACMQWLGEFQVPACIPLNGSILMKEVSDLIGVPEDKLCRVIRMAATGGFLQEPQPGHVAHSALSASFVANPSYQDAAIFLAGTAVPAALEMAHITQKNRKSSGQTPNSVISNRSAFSTPNRNELPRLRRQWHAYLRHGTGLVCDTATDILTCLEPLQNALVVEVGARSTERVAALVDQYPTLHFTVQLNPAFQRRNGARHSRIDVQHRALGSPQPIQGAAVYILNFPFPEPGGPSTPVVAQIRAELEAHFNVLRLTHAATLVLTMPLQSERGEVGPDTAVLSQIRDLSLLQLAGERELEISEVISVLNGVGDNDGRLVLVNKVTSALNQGVVALEFKYQAYTIVSY